MQCISKDAGITDHISIYPSQISYYTNPIYNWLGYSHANYDSHIVFINRLPMTIVTGNYKCSKNGVLSTWL